MSQYMPCVGKINYMYQLVLWETEKIIPLAQMQVINFSRIIQKTYMMIWLKVFCTLTNEKDPSHINSSEKIEKH